MLKNHKTAYLPQGNCEKFIICQAVPLRQSVPAWLPDRRDGGSRRHAVSNSVRQQEGAGRQSRPARFFRIHALGIYCASRYMKVTIWARVQFALGLKVAAVVPEVTPSDTAQATAPA